MARNTRADIADQDRPEFPVLRCFNDIPHGQSLRDFLGIGRSVLAQDISLVIDAHPLCSKFPLLHAEEPSRTWLLRERDEGEEGDKDRQGTFDDKEILPIVEGSVQFEDAISLCLSVLRFKEIDECGLCRRTDCTGECTSNGVLAVEDTDARSEVESRVESRQIEEDAGVETGLKHTDQESNSNQLAYESCQKLRLFVCTMVSLTSAMDEGVGQSQDSPASLEKFQCQ